MTDHEHDFWITITGALECACGASKRPVTVTVNEKENN